MIVMMDDDSDDEEKKDDGMLEHKGMAWQSMLLTYLTDKRRRRRRNIFPATTIAEYLSILPYPPQKTNDSSISSVLPVFKKRPRGLFYFFSCSRIMIVTE